MVRRGHGVLRQSKELFVPESSLWAMIQDLDFKYPKLGISTVLLNFVGNWHCSNALIIEFIFSSFFAFFSRSCIFSLQSPTTRPIVPFFLNVSYLARFRACSLLSTCTHPFRVRSIKKFLTGSLQPTSLFTLPPPWPTPHTPPLASAWRGARAAWRRRGAARGPHIK